MTSIFRTDDNINDIVNLCEKLPCVTLYKFISENPLILRNSMVQSYQSSIIPNTPNLLFDRYARKIFLQDFIAVSGIDYTPSPKPWGIYLR